MKRDLNVRLQPSQPGSAKKLTFLIDPPLPDLMTLNLTIMLWRGQPPKPEGVFYNPLSAPTQITIERNDDEAINDGWTNDVKAWLEAVLTTFWRRYDAEKGL